MYWLSRPPYLRWLAAGALFLVAAYMDLAAPSSELYPFVATSVAAGDSVEVEWRAIPQGLFPAPSELAGVARSALGAGTPLVDGLVVPRSDIPPDWWALSADLPVQAHAGTRVLIAIRDPDREVPGVVIEPSATSSFGGSHPGLLAVPPDAAGEVAAALAQQRATLLIRP